MQDRIIAHVDMNSYFASVEQQANPFLRGKAVGVCSYLHEHGCVIAASVEAKAQGIKVGMRVSDARLAVPSAVFVQNEPAKYRTVTGKLFSMLHELSDRVEHYSIDEAFLDLTGFCRDPAEAAFLLSRVKRRIHDEIGEWLRCSIGIAPTRFLAKFASDRKKPDGLVVIGPADIDAWLSQVDLESLCGIGPRMRRRFERLGITTPLKLKQYPVGNLMRAFGKQGFYWWCRLHAIECERIDQGVADPKSIGHSYCVPNRVNREGKVAAVLAKLTERAGRRLRAKHLLAGSVSVAVGFRGSGYGGDWMRLDEPADDSFTLARVADDILRAVWDGEPVDFLAVTLFELEPPTGQLRFGDTQAAGRPCEVNPFDGARMRDRYETAVSKSVDAIRDRYGDEAILFGRQWPVHGGDEAPDRIGYRKTLGLADLTSA